ncbi:MAG: hypothetical protein HY903_14065 [Deltaproteobacteria bacterium]|nr:hypothetical protein [Deltaproteobacteria bacterium]
MSGCKFPGPWLMAWLDDEMDEAAERARAHVKECRECAAKVEAWRAAGQSLVKTIDRALGDVEPLLGLEKIHARIAATEELPFFDRLRRAVDELVMLHRRAVAGAAVAMALGALSAPAAVFWLGARVVDEGGPLRAAVVVESLEVGGAATAVVWSGADQKTAIIWVESDANADATDEAL